MTQDTSDTPMDQAPSPTSPAATPKAAAKAPRVRRAASTDTTLVDAANQSLAAKASSRKASRVNFFRSKTSVFTDGYDIERERIEVLPVINRVEAGETIAATDPMFDRYMMFLDRSKELQRITAQRQRVAEAPSPVTREELNAYRALGGLVNAADEEDTISIHTKEAFRLFIGRAADPDSKRVNQNPAERHIISFKKAGAAYRLLWNLSTNNNPWADWALIELSKQRNLLQAELAKSVKAMEDTLEQMKKSRGITYAIAMNPAPQSLPIRFKSPYGYALIESLAEFDFLVRLIRTMVHKARLTTELADSLIRDHMRMFRAHFNEVKRFEKYLGDPDLLLTTRNDFLPTADDVARKRVSKCIEAFGNVPRSVFAMEVIPPFKNHRGDLSDAEKELLKRVTSGVMDDQEEAEARSHEAGASGLL
jgi:integrating conjugative element protein (TIGR03761 family)